MFGAAGEVPDQPGVDIAEQQISIARLGPRARHVLEDPADLAARKVGVYHQTRSRCDVPRLGRCGQLSAEFGRAAALPYDRRSDGLAGRAVPDDGGLALVGDTGGHDVARRNARLIKETSRGAQLGSPDF